MSILLFLAGFLSVSYGLFMALADSVPAAAVWILVGLVMQLASGASVSGGDGRLRNPLRALVQGFRDIRAKVQDRDHRP